MHPSWTTEGRCDVGKHYLKPKQTYKQRQHVNEVSMAYSQKTQMAYLETLKSIKDNGLYKNERLICDVQGAEIEVEFPVGSPHKELLNMCSNNYLGLSSHPDIVKAAHDALDYRGYGLSSVRFICGTQDIHKQLEKRMSEFLVAKN